MAEIEGLVVGIEADIAPLLRSLTLMENRVKASLARVARDFGKLDSLPADLARSLDAVGNGPSPVAFAFAPATAKGAFGGVESGPDGGVPGESDATVSALQDRAEALTLVSAAEGDLVQVMREQSTTAERASIAHEQLGQRLKTVGGETDSLRQGMAALDGLSRGIGRNIAGAFEDAILAGKGLSEILAGLERDLLRLLTRNLVINPLANAVGGLLSGSGESFGNFFSLGNSFLGDLLSNVLSVPLFHEGGRVGSGRQMRRTLSPAHFRGAQRFGSGGIVGFQPRLQPGEVPAILHRGETVRTVAQESALQAGRAGEVVFAPGAIVINTADSGSFLQARSQVEAALRDAVMRGIRNR